MKNQSSTSLCLSKFNIFFPLLHFSMGSLVHTTRISSHTPYERMNIINTLPWSNRSVLICLPNRLFDFALNSMNLSKALDFLSIYPKIEYLLIKWSHNHTFHILTQKGSYTWVCTNLKHSLVQSPLKIKRSLGHFPSI